jgi:hypothetical protein
MPAVLHCMPPPPGSALPCTLRMQLRRQLPHLWPLQRCACRGLPRHDPVHLGHALAALPYVCQDGLPVAKGVGLS